MKAAQLANSTRRNLSIPLACGLFACISFHSSLSRAAQYKDSWQATNQTLTVEEATKRFEQTPEGLFLLDPDSNDPTATLPMSALDYGKPTLVYVHGWQNKRIHMPDIPNRKRWGETHNLLIMRWHKRAFDDSHECPVALSIAIKLLGVSLPLPPKKVYPEGCPKSAEQAIWGGADPTGEFFVRQWKTFFGQHKGYEQEIRVVPVSLGTQPAIYMTYRLYEEEWPGSKPNRLDILDSYVGMQIVDGTGQMPADSPFPIPPHSGLPPSSSMGDFVGAHSCDEQSAGKHIVCVEENALYWLKTFFGVAIISYWTGVNFRLLPQLGGRIPQFSPVLKLSTDWLCSRDSLNLLDAKSPRCRWLLKDRLNEVGAGWHNGAVWGYFWSIDETVSKPEPFTAMTTTEEILEMEPGIRTQDVKEKWCNLPQSTNWLEVCRSVFLGETKDSVVVTPRLMTKEEFVTRMQQHYGLSLSNAVQCAKAMTLSH